MADKKLQKLIAWMALPTLALVVFLSLVLGDFYFFYSAGPNQTDQTVIIPKGASLKSVAGILEDEEVLSFRPSFYWTARLSGAAGELRAGEYLIPARASQADILTILKAGKTILHKITIPEGTTSREVVALLLADRRLAGAIDSVPGEGTLLPETYLFERGDSRDGILIRMAENRDTVVAKLWNDYDYTEVFSTPEEAVILASIVEEETALAEERPLIAAVFLNRLERDMHLQSDPTVIYGLGGGVPLGHALRQSELENETPYNTYVIKGLPAGPISNPGMASLEAVFNPTDTEALYFVADGSGGHVFANTLEEHNQNVVRWRRFQRENSEK